MLLQPARHALFPGRAQATCLLAATVGEDDGVTLTAAVREGRRPRPGFWTGPWWSGWRCDGYRVVMIASGLFGGDLGDGGAGGCLVAVSYTHLTLPTTPYV